MPPRTAVTRQEFELLRGDMKDIRKAVFGNGEEGMDEQVRYIVRWIKVQEKEKEETKARQEWYFRTVVGTAIAALVMLIFNGFLFFIKILPILDNLSQP